MTLTEARPRERTSEDSSLEVSAAAARPEPVDASSPKMGRFGAQRVLLLVVLGLVVLMVAVGTVIYGMGPLIHNRDQRNLMNTERSAIDQAVHDNQGLYRGALPTQPPVPGDPLGILAIPAIGLQQAVVEGVGPSQTVAGPGHVPGTAGLGQPGNSAVVARRDGYGGPFGQLSELRPGTRVVTATTEGQSVYVVRSVRTVTLVTKPPATVSTVTTTTLGRPVATKPASGHHAARATKAGTTVSATTLYGQPGHNQLTLVSSASGAPWNTDQAVVVVARLSGKPYVATPQESRSPSQGGNSGDPGALAWLVLALLALVATILGAVALYRRSTVRSAYLLTTAPLLAFTVLTAEAVSRLLPAWL